MSGRFSCSSETASTPSFAVSTRMPLRSSRPLRHAAHRDRIITNQREGAPIALIQHDRFGGRARHSDRTREPMSRIRTMRPSPNMVAPAMPRIAEICGPRDFTTISRLPTSSSVTRGRRVFAGAYQHHRHRNVRVRQARGP